MHKMDWETQKKVTPCGCQTLSKMPSRHVEGVYPKFLAKASGPYVWDDQGNKYVDFPLGIGAIVLGHNHESVVNAVADQLKEACLLSLPHKLEGVVASKIIDLIPSAESVRFVKTGSEATTAAVKIARSYTGRDKIICCGYHGWHDWYNITTPKNKGIPKAMKDLAVQVKYNDLNAIAASIDENTAAVILEPYVYEEPKEGFLHSLKMLCKTHGALLIFDEVVTALRTPQYSAQALFGVIPDLTCLGKGLGNGMAINAVCGKAEIMAELEKDCFISSTFGGELPSLAAANAVLDFCKENDVPKAMYDAGVVLKCEFNDVAESLGVSARCIGYPWRTFFTFPTPAHKSLFWQKCLSNGIFFGYAQYVSFAHTERLMYNEVLAAVVDALYYVKKHWDDPNDALRGSVAQATYRLIATGQENAARIA